MDTSPENKTGATLHTFALPDVAMPKRTDQQNMRGATGRNRRPRQQWIAVQQ